MSEINTREIIDRYARALETNDYDTLVTFLHDDYVEDYPQSGERIRGAENLRAILTNYPGGESMAARLDTLVGTEDRWVVTASYTPMLVAGTGDQYTAVAHIIYPDGSDWHVVQLIKLRDGKIYRITSYYAERFEAPDWRAPYVERVEPS